jgi:hypothetical protein
MMLAFTDSTTTSVSGWPDVPRLEGRGPPLREQDRVALALDVARIAVDLVQEQVARRHRAQPDRAVGASQDQHPARELLR